MLFLRVIVSVMATLGAALVLPHCTTAVYDTAFQAFGTAFSWLFLLCTVFGVLVFWKITK